MVTQIKTAAKRHQHLGRRNAAADLTLFTKNRAKAILSTKVPAATDNAKKLLASFGYEVMGLIAENAQEEMRQRRRITVQPMDVVRALKTRALMIAVPVKPKAGKKLQKKKKEADKADKSQTS